MACNSNTLAGISSPYSDSVSLRLRDSYPLASLHTITRRLILQKARRHPALLPGSDLLRVYGFRFYFTPLAGVLFAFPSRYCCAIGRILYLALDRGRPGFRRDSSCPAVLRIPLPIIHHFKYGAFTLSGRLSQNLSSIMHNQISRSCNPAPFAWNGLGSSDFARRYFRNLVLISVPGVLRWFSSPSIASAPYVFRYG